ncbi:MAG: hypothetical protein ACSNEK_07550 [Parachlamydiaceae bacterium]
MNEYEYYEFYAINRALTNHDIAELRDHSPKAEITPHQFINVYSWECFSGDEDLWLEKYFDTMLYYSNRGKRRYRVKVPCDLLDPKIAATYCIGSDASFRLLNDQVIIDFSTQSQSSECNWQLSHLLHVYEVLVKGDYRCLYLGWLANIQSVNDFDDSLEPPIPAGLRELPDFLQYFVKFLNLDQNLLAVASSLSFPLRKDNAKDNHLSEWVKQLSAGEKDQILIKIAKEGFSGNYGAAIDFVRRYKQERVYQLQKAVTLRTAIQLKYLAQQTALKRDQQANEQALEKLAEEARVFKLIKQQRFHELRGSETLVWSKIESLVEGRHANGYDTAIALIRHLKNLDKVNSSSLFSAKYNELKNRHSRKASFMAKLDQFENLGD